MASGLRVPSAIADYLIIDILRESHGGAVTVSDEEMLAGMKTVASLEGVFMCPEGAATAVAAQKLLSDGTLSDQDSVILLNTGSGLKYLDLLEQSPI
jgi:threonine synthase